MKKIFTLIILSIILWSCAAPIQNLTKTQYINPAFTDLALKDGGLALLPITAGQGQEGYRRPLGDYVNQDLQSSVPNGKVLTWQETMELLNKNSKVSAYEDLILAYRQTSILNRDKVKELSSALGVRYALYCSLQDYSESKETSYNLFSGWNTTKTANVMAHCLVIDLESGDVMQEIIGRAASVAGTYSYNEGYEEYAKVIAYSVLTQLPGAKIPPIKKKK
jgi:hypothetical protein